MWLVNLLKWVFRLDSGCQDFRFAGTDDGLAQCVRKRAFYGDLESGPHPRKANDGDWLDAQIRDQEAIELHPSALRTESSTCGVPEYSDGEPTPPPGRGGSEWGWPKNDKGR